MLTKTINLERAVWPFSHCENIRGFVGGGVVLMLKHKNKLNSYTKCWKKEERIEGGGKVHQDYIVDITDGQMLFSIYTDCYV